MDVRSQKTKRIATFLSQKCSGYRKPTFWVITLTIFIVAAAALMLLTNRSGAINVSKLKNVGIEIEIVGAEKESITTEDFMKMPLVEREMVKINADGSEEKYTLTGVTFWDLVSYVGVDYLVSAEIHGGNGNGSFIINQGFLAVYSSGKLLTNEDGPVMFVSGTQTREDAWIANVKKIVVSKKDHYHTGMAYIPDGPNKIENASVVAGYKVATLTKVPEVYRTHSIIIERQPDPITMDKDFKLDDRPRIVMQTWYQEYKDGLRNSPIWLTQHRLKSASDFDGYGESVEINEIRGWMEVREKEGDVPGQVSLSWVDDLNLYNLIVPFEGEINKDYALQLAESVQ